MTHYDLDGVTCDILMSKMYNFEAKHKCGYMKVKEKISQGDLMWYDSCVVTDISLTLDQYLFISGEYKDRFLYIDHHGPSIKMINDLPKNFSKCLVDHDFSASAIILRSFKALQRYDKVFDYVAAVDAYDKWRIQTHPERFEIGYELNSLFWNMGYDDFYARFSHSMTLDYTHSEQQIVDGHKRDRDAALAASDMNDFGKNSILILNPPAGYINDYTLQYPDYDFYYMVYNNNDNMTISVRSSLDYVNIGMVLRQVRDENELVITAGGHPQAGGADLDGMTPLDDILNVIEQINSILETQLVPF